MVQHLISTQLRLLERALEQCEQVIAAISSDQADWPTPCHGWSVQDVLHHLVIQDLHNFTVMARGSHVDPQLASATVGADWSTRFGDGAKTLMRAWAAADLSAQVALPGGGEAPLRSRIGLQTAEFTVHTWDLAKSTSVPVVLDHSLAEQSHAWSQRVMKPEYRGPGKPFGHEVHVPLNMDSYSRLAGWFGRDPMFVSGPRVVVEK